MIDNTWVMDLPQVITTIISTRGQAILRNKYPKALWTTEDVKNSNPTFPTILLSFDLAEVGNDLNGIDINGVMCTVDVNITVTKSQGIRDARWISGVAMNEFKKLRFVVNEMPRFDDNTNDLIRLIFRARRIIGQADMIQ